MNGPRQALLVVGSPRPTQSTSRSLGQFLLERLQGHGWITRIATVNQRLRREAHLEAFGDLVAASDLLILTAPVYVGGLPYPLTAVLEWLAPRLRSPRPSPPPQLTAILNCGFLQAYHCDLALAICHQFAQETGLPWAGGLTLGGGEALGGAPLDQAWWTGRWVRRSLMLAADALARGEPIGAEAAAWMRRPLMPEALYHLAARLQWWWLARPHGVQASLGGTPYAPGGGPTPATGD